MKYTCFLLVLFVLINIPICETQTATSPLWADLKPGKFDPGFTTVFLVDSSRLMRSTDSLPHAIHGRPIRLKIYYPGFQTQSDIKLRFSEQINIIPENPQFATYNTILSQRDHRLQGQFHPSSDSLLRVLLHLETMAYWNIPRADVRLPLLIYVLGLDDHQMENSIMWEYLASHGYIVAVLPCFGPDMENKFVSYDSAGVMVSYQDATTALQYILRHYPVDEERIGAIGHSFGGLVVHYLSTKNFEIKAIATLDGSQNMERGQPIIEKLNLFASKVRIPMLCLYTMAQGARDLSYVHLQEGPLYEFAFTRASHFDFQNWPMYAVVTATPDARGERLRNMKEGRDILIHVIRMTRHFFDYVFYQKEEGEAYIKGISREAKNVSALGEFNHE